MNKSQVIHKFWNSFGIPAYDQYTVPLDTQMPYITYSVSEADFDAQVSLNASIWYRSPSWEDIELKSYEISRAISRGGKVIEMDDGKIWIYKGTPFAQRMSDTDDTVRRIVINIVAEYFSND